jgi:hypothetical protein
MMFDWAPTRVLEESPTLFSYASLFGGLDICDVAWPKASCYLSCDSWNLKDVLLEQRISKADYQDFHQVNWDKVLKKNTPNVLVVHQPQRSTLRSGA